MIVSEFKKKLVESDTLVFELPNGELVPSHFHVTEVGQVEKIFIDCGGTVRNERKVNLQLWEANDYDHRLHPNKLLEIVELSERRLGIDDLEIEVEYQGSTIGKYGLEAKENGFVLTATTTDCLAKDNCGVPEEKTKVEVASSSCCSPETGCC
ncbi:MAG: hypothetical protein HRT71_03035 [Flavobacteriales bacterium]|nr:hypothetical protein [Flavobacteriales bacterium]